MLFFFLFKDFVCSCEDILQEIKSLIDRLCARDEKIEQISIWLEGNLEELRFLSTVQVLGKLHLKSFLLIYIAGGIKKALPQVRGPAY